MIFTPKLDVCMDNVYVESCQQVFKRGMFKCDNMSAKRHSIKVCYFCTFVKEVVLNCES